MHTFLTQSQPDLNVEFKKAWRLAVTKDNPSGKVFNSDNPWTRAVLGDKDARIALIDYIKQNPRR